MIADGMALAGDSTNSLGQRAWGATKAAGVAAMHVAGGVIIKRVLGRVFKLKGLFRRAGKLAKGAVRNGAKAARRGTAAARQLGRQGEAAVRAAYDIGPSQAIEIGGRTRIPDGINKAAETLSEVKNVKSLSFTSQLRDYAAWARREGYTFNLYVAEGAKLSGTLTSAQSAGLVNIIRVPMPR